MNKTGIEYLDYTWNPIVMRCTRISEACDNCWHLRAADRLKENPNIPMAQREAYAGDRAPILVKGRLTEPSKVKKPSIIGIQFMGDYCHESLDFHDHLDPIMAEMIDCDWHTFLILTKRVDRLLEYHNYLEFENTDGSGRLDTSNWEWPKNIWIGATVENDHHLDRIETLLSIPAAVHFISAEPLLGAIDVSPYLANKVVRPCEELTDRMVDDGYSHEGGQGDYKIIDAIFCGAETGVKNKRHMNLDWARSLRDQSVAAGASFFFKKDSGGHHELDGKMWEQLPERIQP